MTEFETQNTVEVVVDDRSLTEAKADVEDALSSVPIDVQAEVSGAGGGNEVAARDRARQRQLLTDQTSSIEGLREELGETDSEGEWQEEHALSRERNRLLEQLVDAQEEGNFDRAARAGGGLLGGGAAILGGGALLGVGALSSLLSNFSWPDLPNLEPPDWLPPRVPEPDWHPLNVVEPDPVPVEEPNEVPVEEPSEVPVEQPDPIPIADPTSASTADSQPAADPQPAAEPTSAEESSSAPDSLPFADIQRVEEASAAAEPAAAPDSSSEGASEGLGALKTIAGLSALGIGSGAAYALRNAGSTAVRGAASAAGGAAFMTPEGIGVTDHEKMNRRKRAWNKHTPDFMNAEMMKESEEHPGSVFSAEGRQAQAEGIREMINALKELREDVRSTEDDTSSTRKTDVTIESNVTLDGATRREVERGFENAKEEALREFNRQISPRR